MFAIPLNQEFVFIEDQNLDVLDTNMLDVNRALKYCLGIMEENTRENKPPLRNGLTNFSPRVHASSLFEIQLTEHCFKKFLGVHVQAALGKGFDDTLGRHTNTAHYEVNFVSPEGF